MGPRLFSRGMRCWRGRWWRWPAPCFNGAAALQPRNGRAARGARGPDTASMGPRLFSRGMKGIAGPGRPKGSLQWGRGSSAAEWTAGRWYQTDADNASMGPRLFSRGMSLPIPGVAHNTTASMGPRLFSRGICRAVVARATSRRRFNGAAALQPRNRRPLGSVAGHVPRASMGPRLFSRGIWVSGAPSVRPCTLQWGRGSSAAESVRVADDRLCRVEASMGPRLFSRGISRRCGGGRRCRRLQWGRGSSAAESSCTRKPTGTTSQLQWGRGSSAAESAPGLLLRRGVGRFNGAAALQPRNRHRSQVYRSQRPTGPIATGDRPPPACHAGQHRARGPTRRISSDFVLASGPRLLAITSPLASSSWDHRVSKPG